MMTEIMEAEVFCFALSDYCISLLRLWLMNSLYLSRPGKILVDACDRARCKKPTVSCRLRRLLKGTCLVRR